MKSMKKQGKDFWFKANEKAKHVCGVMSVLFIVFGFLIWFGFLTPAVLSNSFIAGALMFLFGMESLKRSEEHGN